MNSPPIAAPRAGMAEDFRAALVATAKPSIHRTKRTLFKISLLSGGFFVFLGFFLILAGRLATDRSVASAIPNSALAAVIFHKNSGVKQPFGQFFPILKSTGDDESALILLPQMEWGVVTRFPTDFRLRELPAEFHDLRRSPIRGDLVAIGSPQFLEYLHQSEKIPWAIALKIELKLTRSQAQLLWGPDQAKPWTFGAISKNDHFTQITMPWDQEEYNSPLTAIEEVVRATAEQAVVQSFPQLTNLKLPDGTVARELKSDKAKFSWKSSQKNEYSLVNTATGQSIFSYLYQLNPQGLSPCSETLPAKSFTVRVDEEILLYLDISKNFIFLCF